MGSCCPKCNAEMLESPVIKIPAIDTYICPQCGYIEFYLSKEEEFDGVKKIILKDIGFRGYEEDEINCYFKHNRISNLEDVVTNKILHVAMSGGLPYRNKAKVGITIIGHILYYVEDSDIAERAVKYILYNSKDNRFLDDPNSDSLLVDVTDPYNEKKYSVKIAKLLLEYGANPNAESPYAKDYSILDVQYSADNEYEFDVAEISRMTDLLIQYGAESGLSKAWEREREETYFFDNI